MSNKPTPHPHADLIKAWADGAHIQYFDEKRNVWDDCLLNAPTWGKDIKYRIKPEEPWKPKGSQEYFVIDLDKLDPSKETWGGYPLDEERYKKGNCFQTLKEAKVVKSRVESVLKNNWVKELVAVESIDGKPLSIGEKKLIQAIRKTVLRGTYNEKAILVFPLDGSVDSTSHIIAFDTHGDDINDNKIREAINLIAEEQTEEEIKNGQKPKK